MSDNIEKTNLGGEHELLLRLAENCASKQNGLHINGRLIEKYKVYVKNIHSIL